MKLGAVEGGGTKFLCAVFEESGELARTTVATTTPAETLAAVAAFFAPHGIAALGVATFGPLDLARGRTLRTPKPGWSGVDVVGALSHGVPVALETDVNAAAIAEADAWGTSDLAYLTVGTGVGVGVVVDGRPVHGRMHPELGHLTPARFPGDTFEGACPFHGACVEGLASGPAIRARTGRAPEELADDDPDWEPVVDALAQLVGACHFAYAPERIVLGGGVMRAAGLRGRVRGRVAQRIGTSYGLAQLGVAAPDEADVFGHMIVAPRLGDGSGLAGAHLLARSLAAAAASK